MRANSAAFTPAEGVAAGAATASNASVSDNVAAALEPITLAEARRTGREVDLVFLRMGSSDAARLTHLGQRWFQLHQCATDAGFDRADGCIERRGNLLVSESVEKRQRDRPPLLRAELRERAPHRFTDFTGRE